MPITIRCPECSQVLKVPDAMAGRRGKCPKCSVILEIPVPKGPAPEEAEPEEPARSAPRSARQSKAAITRDQPAPSRRKAPAKTEEEDDAVDPEIIEDDDDSVDPEEVEDRPRRRRKKKPRKSSAFLVLLIGGLGLGLLLCSGGGALTWWIFFSASIEDELKFMPNNCQVVVSVRTDQMMKSDVFQELRREVPDVDKQKSDFSKEIGLSADDVEQVVVGVGSSSKDVVVVIRTRKAVDAADLRGRIQNAKYTENKVGKYTVQEPQNSVHPTFSVVDRKHVVYGEKDPVRAVLLRDKKPDLSQNMQAAMKRVDFSKSLVVAADVQSSRNLAGNPADLLGNDQQWLTSLQKTNAIAAQVHFSSDVRLEITLFCQDAGAANNIKKLIDDLLVMARSNQNVPREVSDLLELNLKVNGSELNGSTAFKVGPLIKLYKQTKGKF